MPAYCKSLIDKHGFDNGLLLQNPILFFTL